MADIYAYITHKDSVADDTALELVAAAQKIDPHAAVTAIVTGSGSGRGSIGRLFSFTLVFFLGLGFGSGGGAGAGAESSRSIALLFIPREISCFATSTSN